MSSNQFKNKSTVKDYQTVIRCMDILTMKMEAITQKLFEANVDFICKLKEPELKEELNDSLSTYGTRFQGVLEALEEETKLLKREKAYYQFRNNLIETMLIV
ncbi:hypothetical protein JMN32_03450 [Fulvivirga sp. 29W222]|uniref:Uncharacterized protein n=1 Tax=Fulvivirga marina TaxID=2494733 RepID=A0A937FVK9_9BACT|nr:hypothetical protein [Fulvivirga marina]MBL6445347.1 hypothetical protein [Fulvivirga marina]